VTVVIDASAVVAALPDNGEDGLWAESMLTIDSLAAPHLMPVEAANILRRLALAGDISADTASLAHNDLLDLNVELVPYEPVASRIWTLRKNVTCYNAWYVAVAETLDGTLVTLDWRLAAAPGTRCRFQTPPDAPEGHIHQEDFNQVLGAEGNQKYQKYGGQVSLERIAKVFSTAGDYDSRARLYKLVVLSVAVGNLDLHAKNLSLLHRPDGSMTLCPAYDVVPQAHQPNDGEVALAIGGEYRHAAITLNHLVAEGRAWGLAEAAGLAEQTLTTVLQLAQTQTPDEHAYPGLADDIAGFASNLLARRAVGTV